MTSPIPPLRTENQAPQPVLLAVRNAGMRIAGMRSIQAFWPLALVIKLFLSAALFGLFGLLPPWLHLLLFTLFALSAAIALGWGVKHYHQPQADEVRRAVEKASALAHRPLSTLADAPAQPSPLWQPHRERMAQVISRAQLRLPQFNLPRHGLPLLGYASWALLLIAVVVAGSEGARRLQSATQPNLAALLPQAKLDAFITPPAYTNLPPIALDEQKQALTVPQGSVITLRVHGGWFPPRAILSTLRQRLSPEGEQDYKAEIEVTNAGPLSVTQDGRQLGAWQIGLLVDALPQIDFRQPPKTNRQFALILSYQASDDLGLQKIEAIIRRNNQELVLPMPSPAIGVREAKGQRSFDLTAHEWAGQPVTIELRATDTKGQSDSSAPVPFTLPERKFNNPISKALIGFRRELMTRGILARRDGLPLLDGLLAYVEEKYTKDWLGYLSLRSMADQLRFNQRLETLPPLIRQLWDTALHFDDGGTSQAMQNLRQAQQELEDALKNGASDGEIQRLMEQYAQAVQEYLKNLSQNPEGQQQGQGQPSQTLTGQDMQSLLETLRNMAGSGARDQALQMLSQMQQMLENLQMSSGEPQPGTTDPLGRDQGKELDHSSIEIPDADATQRASRLLEDLRQRSADPTRSEEERSYIDRLLKWF